MGDAGGHANGPDSPGGVDGDHPGELTASERQRLAALSEAESLADLVALTGVATVHEAYFAAKAEWATLWERRESERTVDPEARLPGERVRVGDAVFYVHGVTHDGTDAERSYLRGHVSDLLEEGATVYAEQGLRGLYFADLGVCEMDDYRWALERCERLDDVDRFEGVTPGGGHLDRLAERLREAAYPVIERYRDVYGETVERTLGGLASALLTDHEGVAVGEEYEAFRLRHAAAEDPTRLPALQSYYRRTFLPQPVEREWVRRHDPDLEAVTHGRNARMADYAVYHHGDADEVHLVVGAAHGPGVVYYLRRHAAGERSVTGFEIA